MGISERKRTMKLSLLLLGLTQAQELALAIKDEFYTQLAERRVKVEEGGKFESPRCKTANKWTLLKLGNTADAAELKPTSEAETDARYNLKNNALLGKRGRPVPHDECRSWRLGRLQDCR